MLSGEKFPGYRFPLAVIGYAVWFCHRFTLSSRDVEELLLERGVAVTRETIRAWCIKFSASSLRVCATGNPDGVPGGISTRCA